MDGLLCSPVTWAAIGISTLYLIYRWGTSTFTYFSDQGIPGPKPLPVVGNMWGLWKQNLPKYDRSLMKKYGKVVGYFDGRTPNLWTTDVDLIKSIFVKDFDHFINRREFAVRTKVVRKMITLIRDQEWKDLRSAVTPSFTTGKIKRMSVMIKECSDRLAKKFEAITDNKGKLNAKDEFSAFTMDVIARCVFAMTIDSLDKKDNPFMEKARRVFNPPINSSPLILLPFVFPKLNIVTEKVFASEDFQFFFRILDDLIEKRGHTKEKYHDFIEVASEAIADYDKTVDGKKVSMWDKEEVNEIVIAQSALFLLAGFDTTATTLTNTCFLLARNPDVQEKLYEEITAKLENFGDVSHEMILDFPYVDHIVHEVLRMYPPALRVERECNKDVTYKGVHIKKGTLVTVPSFALHYDPDYYPEPEKFDPDRWDHEKNPGMNQYAWMPFGMGPRNCIGMRFALEEIKIALCTLVKQFRFFPVEETPEKMVFEDGFIGVVQPKHAIVGIEMRN